MKTKIAAALTLIVLVATGSYFLINGKTPTASNTELVENGVVSDNSISISILVPAGEMEPVNFSVKSDAGTNLADIMEQLALSNPEFTYEIESASFGDFITSINGVKADSNKEFWNIKVNGTDSTVGIKDLLPQANDVISFNLTSF